MPDLWDIDDWVEQAALLPIMKFYPSVVAADTGISVQDVFRRLLAFVEDGRLYIRWEIRCQSYGCARTIKEVDDVKEPIGSLVRCICGEEYEIGPDILFPVFGFQNRYRQRTRQKAKKKQSLLRHGIEKRLQPTMVNRSRK